MKLIVLAVLALSVSVSARASEDLEAESLRGVTAIKVIFGNLNANAIEAGLSQQELQTAVELRCRMAGLKVVTSAASDDDGFLYIDILSYKQKYETGYATGGYAVAVKLEFVQPAYLARDPQHFITGSTWSRIGLIAGTRDRIAQSVSRFLLRRVDEFLNAYLAQNPKTR
jgi:hypothetical protein